MRVTTMIEPLERRQLFSANPTFVLTNLVSDGTFTAPVHDPNISGPWGLAINSTDGSVWVNNGANGLATIYNNGVPATGAFYNSATVTIPPSASGAAVPTSTLFNNTRGFAVSNGTVSKPATFLFASLSGSISGWNASLSPTLAFTAVDDSANGAVFSGMTFANQNGRRLLYAADFHNGQIDVFDKNFAPVTLKNNFSDPTIPVGFAPFEVQAVGDHLVVTYAMQDDEKVNDVAGAGNGFVDVFSTNGKLIRRLASNGTLNSPWAVTVAPSSFGKIAGDLLVGNFGDGRINVFNQHGKLIEQLEDANQQPISIDGLWGLIPGTKKSGNPGGLYFASETDNVFGTLKVNRSQQFFPGY